MKVLAKLSASCRVWCLLVCAFASGTVLAEPAGHIINVSGPLFVIKGDGSKRALSVGSQVEAQDTLVTEEKTFARVRFSDGGEATLRPNTQLKVDAYTFNPAEPKSDNVVLSLFKGALRSLTGAIGKRGNQNAYQLQTATATIGIRGTQFIAELVDGDEAVLATADEDIPALARMQEPLPLIAYGGTTVTDIPMGYLPASNEPAFAPAMQLAQSGPLNQRLSPGLYVHVIDGLIQLSNRGGVQQFSAGQFGFAGSVVQPPVIVPNNPGIQFNPPPAFSSSSVGSGPGNNKGAGVDCELR